MSKHPFKKWRCEAKPYKLEVRMVNRNVLDEYPDEELCGGSLYVDDEICKILRIHTSIVLLENFSNLVLFLTL